MNIKAEARHLRELINRHHHKRGVFITENGLRTAEVGTTKYNKWELDGGLVGIYGRGVSEDELIRDLKIATKPNPIPRGMVKGTWLFVVKEIENDKWSHRRVWVRCVCGEERAVLWKKIRLGKTRSCGCKGKGGGRRPGETLKPQEPYYRLPIFQTFLCMSWR